LPIDDTHSEIDNLNVYQWGLDRIDQDKLPLNLDYNPNKKYNGSSVRVYVLDTGINTEHEQFEGRAISGINTVDQSGNTHDGHSHGTHVASTVAGKDVGVSKATVVAVKVLNDDGVGSGASVIRGIDWAIKDATENGHCGIISMSLGGGFNQRLNDAVNVAVKAGVNVVSSAGNSAGDTCNGSPASAELGIAVGSIDNTDEMSYFSNNGICTDVFAPGRRIIGADSSSNTGFNSKSGTSMAAPHVAGALAIYLERHGCGASLDNFYKMNSMDQIIGNINGAPNAILRVANVGDLDPTKSPTKEPTRSPTKEPTRSPTKEPTRSPTKEPTRSPDAPTRSPTKEPTRSPDAPTRSPTKEPTRVPKVLKFLKRDFMFELNERHGRLFINDINIYWYRTRPIVWKNSLVTEDDNVQMTIGSFSGNSGIPPIITVYKVYDGAIEFIMSHSDHGQRRFKGSNVQINYQITKN
jgi:subtilisin family serine protease